MTHVVRLPRRAVGSIGREDRPQDERHRRQAAVVADRVGHHAFGALLAQRTVFQIEEGADRALLFTQLLELVDTHGLNSVATSAFVDTLAKRVTQ